MKMRGLKKCLSILFLFKAFLYSNNLLAQYDTLKYVNGVKQAAKIIEISDKYVKFKNPKDTLGPTFSVSLKNVEQFIFKNGCFELQQFGYKDCVKDPKFGTVKNNDFTRNIYSLDLLQLFNQHFQITGEHIAASKTFGISAYINLGLSDETDLSTFDRKEARIAGGYYKKLYYGLDFKFYPVLHKKTTPWFALGAEMGTASTLSPVYTYGTAYSATWPYSSYTVTTITMVPSDRTYFGYHFSGGFLMRVHKHFICQGNLSLGLNQFEYIPEAGSNDKSAFAFSIKLSAGFLVGFAF